MRTPARLLFLVVPLALAACGARGAGPATAARPVRLSGALLPEVQAEFEQVTPCERSATMTVSFHNHGDRDVRVTGFRVRWSAGALDVPVDLRVPAGARAEAALRVGPEAGDLDELYARPMGVRVAALGSR